MKQGVFITFEGNDGSGKTTVCKAVQEELIKMGLNQELPIGKTKVLNMVFLLVPQKMNGL